MKTRAKPLKRTFTSQATEPRLPPTDDDPPKLFILPKSLSDDATIITLAHPRTLAPSRFLLCPQNGIHELKRFAAPLSACRSILISHAEDQRIHIEDKKGNISAVDTDDNGVPVGRGYILEKAELFFATPIDPLFLILPALSPTPLPSKSDPERTLFLSADDLFERLFDDSRHFQYALQYARVRQDLETRLAAACDSVKAGEETMYRLSLNKLLQEIIRKARKIVDAGLPPSLEEKFVTRALQRPMVAEVSHEEPKATEESMPNGQGKVRRQTPSLEVVESQSTNATTSSSSSFGSAGEADTPITNPSPPASSSDTQYLLRLRTAIQYILSAYFPTHLATTLVTALSASSSPIDYTSLDALLAELAKLRAEAAAARALGTFSRKRTAEEDEERDEKRRRKEEQEEQEKARKKAEPRGLKELRKVDISGMKKMSDFFKRK